MPLSYKKKKKKQQQQQPETRSETRKTDLITTQILGSGRVSGSQTRFLLGLDLGHNKPGPIWPNISPNNAHAFWFCFVLFCFFFFFNPKDIGYESTCYFSCECTVFLSKASQCAYYIWINAVMYGALIITLISTTQLNVLWHWGAQHLSLPKHCVQLWLFFHNDFHFHNSGLLLH